MNKEEHTRQYIDKLLDSNEIPFLLVTFRLDQYPGGNFIGAYSSFQNFGVDGEKYLAQIRQMVESMKQEWDLPTQEELEGALENGWEKSKDSGYWAIREL